MENNLFLGQDLGMGAIKLYGPCGGMQLPSVVAADLGQVVGNMLGFRSRKPPVRIRVEGMSFYVGAEAHDWGRGIENLDYDRLTGVPETRAIFYASLTQYLERNSLTNLPVQMIVGLPLEPLSGPDAQANAEAVRQWMKGEHYWEADGKPFSVTITEVKITSQPSGALFDYLLDEQGAFIPERKLHFTQEMGIISIGFNTLEVLTVKDRAPVQGMTHGTTSGVRRLLELVNGDGMYSLGELDGLLRSGMLDIRTALPVWAREVTGQIEKTWGQRWRRFAGIILVGGGSLLLEETLIGRFNGKVFLPDDPVISIARGLYKLSLMQANRRGI